MRKYLKGKEWSKERGTELSGIDRSYHGRLRYLYNDAALFPWYLLQRLFVHRDLGDGHLVVARKR